MHDGHHVRPLAVDFAVDEPLQIDRAAPGVGRRAVQVVFHDVGRRHQRRPTPGAARSIWSGSSTAKSTANGRT